MEQLQYSSDDDPVRYTLGTDDGLFLASITEMGGLAYLRAEGVGVWLTSESGDIGPVLTGDTLYVSFRGLLPCRLTDDHGHAVWITIGKAWSIYLNTDMDLGLEIPIGSTIILSAPPDELDPTYLGPSPNPSDPNYVGGDAQEPIYWTVMPYLLDAE